MTPRGHGQAIIQDPRWVISTVMGSLEDGRFGSGRAESFQQIRLTVWNEIKSENRPAAGKIDLKMKVKYWLCLMISNPPLFKAILDSH